MSTANVEWFLKAGKMSMRENVTIGVSVFLRFSAETNTEAGGGFDDTFTGNLKDNLCWM